MAKNTSIVLSDHFQDFIEIQVESGRFGSASDVVRAGLRLLEVESAKLKALQDAIDEGINSGPPEPFDGDEFLKQMHKKMKA
jgi:antitoxin ParD1/3/4